ncbi:hypothetical protein R1flu_001770 [Riccia fluitans]|uniref:FAD-binding PCMH-type domain-containing protein n=1 Tax=Riccia fluitans TaxID=41844 RepID=A0ABD1Y4D3_9MARC
MGKSREWLITSRICLFSLLILQGFFNPASASWTARRLLQQSLSDCFKPAGARVVLPSDSQYQSARGHVFNHRFLWSPAAFVFPTTTAQVQNAVQCAVKLSVGISPRCGGHSYEDYSLGGRDGVIVVDLEGMNQVMYDKNTKRATIGGGARLGPIKLALWNQGKVTIPSGTCPSVGVGGHALGGGWGFVSRKFGLMSDSIIEAEVVLANGSVVTANSGQNSDLLFALKGAGANSFGIVTKFIFRTFDVSKTVTFFQYNFQKSEQFATTKAYGLWGVSATNAVSASLYHDPSGGNQFWGVFLGPKANLRSALQTFFNNAPTPSSTTELETDYIHTVLVNGGFKATDDISLLNLNNFVYETRTFKSKSIFVKGSGFSDAGIQAYVNKLQQGPAQSYVIFDLFGGSGSAVNSIKSTASAFVHRDSFYSLQMLTYWNDRPQDAQADINWINGLWSAVRPFASDEAYQNYIDSDMPLSAYYGSNLSKLKTIKRKYDPKNIFNYQQSIPLSRRQTSSELDTHLDFEELAGYAVSVLLWVLLVHVTQVNFPVNVVRLIQEFGVILLHPQARTRLARGERTHVVPQRTSLSLRIQIRLWQIVCDRTSNLESGLEESYSSILYEHIQSFLADVGMVVLLQRLRRLIQRIDSP